MMSILEYSMDVDRSVEEVLELCKKLGIDKTSEDDLLDDVEITLLDNEINNSDEVVETNEEVNDDYIDSDDMFEHIEDLLQYTH